MNVCILVFLIGIFVVFLILYNESYNKGFKEGVMYEYERNKTENTPKGIEDYLNEIKEKEESLKNIGERLDKVEENVNKKKK